jgi:NDP-sugar pyrophosphorylase family protein
VTTLALPTICILAGGLGTRLGSRVADTPKPLLEVAGEPFLVHQLRLLAAHGASEVVLCTGYRGEMIEERIGSSCAGIAIRYSRDSPDLDGTLGAIRGALELLGERFLVLYGDTYLRIDYAGAATAWSTSGLPAMMAVLHNKGRWEPSNADFDGQRVTRYVKGAPAAELEWIDYGLGGLQAQVVRDTDPGRSDLADLYRELADGGALFGFEATERFYEIGTPASLEETERFLLASPAGAA